MNFIGEFGPGDFLKLQERISTSNELFFLKPLGDYTGGTTVMPLTKEVLIENSKLVTAVLGSGAHYLYKNLDVLNITSPQGTHHGTQFRIFINTEGKFMGFIIKFSANALRGDQHKTSLRQLNKALNSSSGTAISLLFENQGATLQPITLSLSKNEIISNPLQITDYIQQLRLGELTLETAEDLSRIRDILLPKATEIVDYFNSFFFEQEWDSLYRKFITDKTYFDD